MKRQSMNQGAGAKDRSVAVWAKTNGRCWYCGQWLVESKQDKDGAEQYRWFAIDHITPKRQGGTDDLDNLLPACWICNCSKGNKNLEEYRIHAGRIAAEIPKFSEEQLAYLASVGFRFPERPAHVFWGETQE